MFFSRLLLTLIVFAGIGSAAHAGPEFRPRIDLHTHLRGILPGAELLQLALEHGGVELSAAELRAARVAYNPNALRGRGAEATVLLARKSFPDGDTGPLERALSLNVEQPGDFHALEAAYDLRRSLTAFDPAREPLYEKMLARVAENYQKGGVSYAEISAPAEMLQPAWEKLAARALPRIEAATGVRLRFLLGIRRTMPPAELKTLVAKIKAAAARDPFLVGADFLGEELNPTRDFAFAIRDLSHGGGAGNFQVRVHAGENALFPDNIKEAIRAGATRIGHGVYGVDDETLQLARANNVIVEMNVGSNLALKNIANPGELPARRYLDAKVRLTVGTDGSGIFGTDSAREAARLRAAGLGEADFGVIATSDDDYLHSALETQKKFGRNIGAPEKEPLPCARGFSLIHP